MIEFIHLSGDEQGFACHPAHFKSVAQDVPRNYSMQRHWLPLHSSGQISFVIHQNLCNDLVFSRIKDNWIETGGRFCKPFIYFFLNAFSLFDKRTAQKVYGNLPIESFVDTSPHKQSTNKS